MKHMRQQSPDEQHPQKKEEEDSLTLTLKTDSSVTSTFALKRHCCHRLKAAFARDPIYFCYGNSYFSVTYTRQQS